MVVNKLQAGQKLGFFLNNLLCIKHCNVTRIYFSTSCAKKRNVRVRFAPSPTGFLHIGGLRTALLNYLFAKSKGGKFIIRIEDTDQSRIVPGAVENLLDQLRWAGIKPDEGPNIGGEHGPYVQSERLHVYQKYANRLLENGSAYRCFCSQKRIDILRRDQIRRKEQTKYDNRCRDLCDSEIKEKLESGIPYVLRLKLQCDIKSFDDLLNGEITHDVASIEGDPVIHKSDGYPTYHLANVIDDHLMEITHILRGKEWLISTVKHIMLYEAFGWKVPTYAHLPLLMNKDGKKLSKRQGDAFVEHHRERGYHPTAVLNFLAHYGAGFSENTGTVFGDSLSTPESTVEKMANEFSLEKVGIVDSVVRFSKLNEYNSAILKRLLSNDKGRQALVTELRLLVLEKYKNENILNEMSSETRKMQYLERVIEIRQTHITVLKDLVSDEYSYVWVRPNVSLEKIEEKVLEFTRNVIRLLEEENASDLSQDKLTSCIRNLVHQSELKMPPAMTLLRMLLIGRKQGPGVGEVICIVGKEEALIRLKKVERLTIIGDLNAHHNNSES